MSQKDQVEGHQIPNQLIKDRLATYMQRLSKQQKTKQKKQQKTKHQKKTKDKAKQQETAKEKNTRKTIKYKSQATTLNKVTMPIHNFVKPKTPQF